MGVQCRFLYALTIFGEVPMILVAEIMTRNVITATAEMEIAQAARLLMENHINGLPVVDDVGSLVGILCQSDIIAQQKKLPLPSLFSFLDGYIPLTSTKSMEREVRKIAGITVGDAMTADPVSVAPDSSIETVASLMVDQNFHTLPVVKEGKLLGIVGKEDVLKTLLEK
jgi:CBS domain-containing protein